MAGGDCWGETRATLAGESKMFSLGRTKPAGSRAGTCHGHPPFGLPCIHSPFRTPVLLRGTIILHWLQSSPSRNGGPKCLPLLTKGRTPEPSEANQITSQTLKVAQVPSPSSRALKKLLVPNLWLLPKSKFPEMFRFLWALAPVLP